MPCLHSRLAFCKLRSCHLISPGEEVPPDLLVPLLPVDPAPVNPCTDPKQKMHLKRPPKDSLVARLEAAWRAFLRTMAFASLPETVASGGTSVFGPIDASMRHKFTRTLFERSIPRR